MDDERDPRGDQQMRRHLGALEGADDDRPAADPMALASARSLLDELLELEVSAPQLSATESGAVAAQWQLAKREVVITCYPGGAREGLITDNTTGESEWWRLTDAKTEQIVAALKLR